ncbi:MAG: ribosome small subunit-dependent GTPase A [Magnetovibrio sp.]|nr:ribosome small subunit-dependent GTPase A [Magnetovibrio sp.]
MSLQNDALTRLGWNASLQQQLTLEDIEQTVPCRVSAVHRGQIIVSHGEGELTLALTGKMLQQRAEHQMTVGDWLLVSRETGAFVRQLERFSLIQRQSAGTDKSQQLIVANVDTLFIVTSCNDDFNLSRLERYLAIAYSAEVYPVIVLTKQDMSDTPQSYMDQARTLGANLIVETVNALDPTTLNVLQNWCKPGQSIALVGSSGVGKSTLANALGAKSQKTGDIREDDAKGRHTTTQRSLLPLDNGAVLIDNPGIRELGMVDAVAGLVTVFEEIAELSQNCRFSDCQHDQEPGCAVKAALEKEELSERRMKSYTKLMAEQERNAATTAERRKKEKATVKFHKKIQSQKKLSRRY